MKKNIAMRLASLVLMCTIVTSCFVSSTFAKYTSTVTGTGTARVAKWDVTVNGQKETAEVDVFTHADANTMVTGADGKKIIAPGTQGSFNVVLSNKSEVTAAFDMSATTVNEAGVPLQWSVDGTNWEDDFADLGVAGLTGNIAIGGADVTKTFYWKWAFDATDNPADGQTDATDTTLGIAGTATPTVSLSAVFTQVN